MALNGISTAENLPELLNAVYEPLCARAKRLCACLAERSIPYARGFYNLHAVRRGDGFFTEHFPIPVVSAEGLGDFGFELDHVFFEAVFLRERALALDFASLALEFDLEVYGAEDFLCDFFHAGMDVSRVREGVAGSAEKEICVCLLFPNGTDEAVLIGAAKRLAAE